MMKNIKQKVFTLMIIVIIGIIIIPVINNGFCFGKSNIPQSKTIDVDNYGLVGDGKTDDSQALQKALDYLEKNGGGIIKFGNKKYLINNVVIPSNVSLVGNSTVIQAKDVFYTTTKIAYKKGSTKITVNNASGINKGDVVTIKGAATDIFVVKAKNQNVLDIVPFRMMYGDSEKYSGLKYDQPKGATVGVRSQIFWISKGLTLESDKWDKTPYSGGTKNVRFENITFRGSRTSNKFSAYNVFDLTSSGALYFYRTTNVKIENCKFYSFYSTPTVAYGWNESFKFENNFVQDVGYVLPNSVPIQERDATSGVTLHWDQRFNRKDLELKSHITRDFLISNNTFNKCWNGGVFVSATKKGIIKDNVITNFISKGISVYGGDYGISTSEVSVYNNKINGGYKTLNNKNLGTGLWISISDGIVVNNNSVTDCATAIITQGAKKTKLNNNSMKSNLNNVINK